jgi:hypothetical protein
MVKAGLLAALAGIAGLMTTTQAAAASGLADQAGVAVASLAGLGWLVVLSALAWAIVRQLLRR